MPLEWHLKRNRDVEVTVALERLWERNRDVELTFAFDPESEGFMICSCFTEFMRHRLFP